jgi:phage shock protein E
MFKRIVVLFVVFLLAGCGSIKSGKISCSDKDVVLDYDNSILIDVRTDSEYKAGHLDGAINIPYEDIVKGVSKLDNVDFDTHIIVYCKSGGRSGQAFDSLKDAGYNNVYDLGAMSKCS